jgi:hypothetical protein
MFLLSSLLLNIFGLAWEIYMPEHLGMDQTMLEEARDYALTGGGSGCIIKNGKMVMAWGDQQQKYDLYSTTSVGYIFLQPRDFSLILFGLCCERSYNFTYPGG